MAEVLHLISGLTTGGAELSLLRLLEAAPGLRSGGVISLKDQGTIGPRLAALGVPVTALGMRGSLPTPGPVLRLRRLVRAARPAVVQGWMYHGNLAAMAVRGVARPAAPVVWNIRHSVYSLDDEKPMTARVIRLGARLSGHPANIIYNSRTAQAQHEALGYAPTRSVVIPNGFDTTRYRPDPAAAAALRAELGLPADALVAGLVGRYHPMKDHGTFLRAAARVAAADPRVHLVLAGRDVDQANPELRSLLTDTGLGGRAHLLGERSDTAGLTAGFDVACSSSYSEGFPNVIGEAMACGVPCVVTDVGDSAWLVGGAGTVVPPRDPAALAAGLAALLSLAPEARRELGGRARRRIEEHFALPAITRRYLDLYAGLGAGPFA